MLYNQNVKSDIVLPEAVKIEPTDQIDISVELGRPPQWVLDKALGGQIDYITEQVMWFNLENLVLFYIENGNRIIVYRQSEQLTELSLRSYLTGSAMALAIMQKGFIPIHGGTVAYQGKGIIVAGESGAGKSTVTMELMQQGLLFVADDISVVSLSDGEVSVFPGFPQQKFCRDVIEKKGLIESELIYIDEDRDKFARILNEGFVTKPLPIACMIELFVSDSTEVVDCYEVKGREKLLQLSNNIYRGLVIERLENIPERFSKIVHMAAKIPMYRINRPKAVDTVPIIVQSIKKQILQVEG